MTRALLLRAGDDHGTLTDLDLSSLRAVQAAVGGDIQEVVLADGSSLVCNEEGKLLGLPMNPCANRLVGVLNPGLYPDDFLVGDVLVVGPDAEDPGAWGAVTDALLDACRDRAGVPVVDPGLADRDSRSRD